MIRVLFLILLVAICFAQCSDLGTDKRQERLKQETECALVLAILADSVRASNPQLANQLGYAALGCGGNSPI